MNPSISSFQINRLTQANPESQNFIKFQTPSRKESSNDSYSDLLDETEENEKDQKGRRSALFLSKGKFLQIIHHQISEIFYRDQSIGYNIMFFDEKIKTAKEDFDILSKSIEENENQKKLLSDEIQRKNQQLVKSLGEKNNISGKKTKIENKFAEFNANLNYIISKNEEMEMETKSLLNKIQEQKKFNKNLKNETQFFRLRIEELEILKKMINDRKENESLKNFQNENYFVNIFQMKKKVEAMKLNKKILSNEAQNFEKKDKKDLLRRKEYEAIHQNLVQREYQNKLKFKLIVIRRENVEKINFLKEEIQKLKSNHAVGNKDYFNLKRDNNILISDIKKIQREIIRVEKEAEIIDSSISSFKSEMSNVLFYFTTTIDGFSEFSMKFNQEASKSQTEKLKYLSRKKEKLFSKLSSTNQNIAIIDKYRENIAEIIQVSKFEINLKLNKSKLISKQESKESFKIRTASICKLSEKDFFLSQQQPAQFKSLHIEEDKKKMIKALKSFENIKEENFESPKKKGNISRVHSFNEIFNKKDKEQQEKIDFCSVVKDKEKNIIYSHLFKLRLQNQENKKFFLRLGEDKKSMSQLQTQSSEEKIAKKKNQREIEKKIDFRMIFFLIFALFLRLIAYEIKSSLKVGESILLMFKKKEKNCVSQ